MLIILSVDKASLVCETMLDLGKQNKEKNTLKDTKKLKKEKLKEV